MSIHSHNFYSDNLAHKKRRRFFIQLSIIGAVTISIIGFAIYGSFYSGWFDVRSISITGFKATNESQLLETIHSTLSNQKILLIGDRYGKNIYLLNSSLIKENILAQYPTIKEVKINKNYPHNLDIDITERTPVGTWCFSDDCFYFDDGGILWGKAIKSSGSLLLTIEDNRTFSEQQNRIDMPLLNNVHNIKAGLDTLNIRIDKIEIKSDSPTDFYAYALNGYYLIFNGEISIDKQFQVLKIFLNEKGSGFKAQYIDLRIDGRVYYK